MGAKTEEQANEVTPTFVCEICHEVTPSKFEGTEPNTCEMCMPHVHCFGAFPSAVWLDERTMGFETSADIADR